MDMAALAEEYATDPLMTMGQIARRHGVTRQRVQQWIAAEDPTAAVRHRELRARSAALRDRSQARKGEVEHRRELEAAWGAGRLCAVCLGPRPNSRRVTCGEECASLWLRTKYHISDEARRASQEKTWRWHLANPERARPDQLEDARRGLAGEERRERGRWVLSPAVAEALVTVGRKRKATHRRWGTR